MLVDPGFDKLIKLLLIGDQSVGKTNLSLRFCNDEFFASYKVTLGFDFFTKTITLNDTRIKVQIYDTAGTEQHFSLCKSLFKGVHGVIVVYDVTQEDSFNNVRKWCEEINENCPDSINTMLMGNKLDLTPRSTDYKSAKQLADENYMLYCEVSAKSGEGVEEGFGLLIESILCNVHSSVNAVYNKSTVKVSTGFNLNDFQEEESQERRRCWC